MMNSIAGAFMEMSAAKLAQSYSVALADKAMSTQEQMAAEMLEMLPSDPGGGVPLGQFIDVYA